MVTPKFFLKSWSVTEGKLREIDIGLEPGAGEMVTDQLGHRLRHQLDEYARGERREFDLPLAPVGTHFQLQVWSGISRIVYGQTMTYSQLASAIGRPRAIRAVANACGANPLPIVIPCHRVVSVSGLGGYSLGLELKRGLLLLEQAVV